MTFLLMMVTFTAWAQLPIDKNTGLFSYQEVVDQTGSQAELYARAREWFVNTYKDANKVIQLDDPKSGQLIGKGKFTVYLSMNNRFVQHTVTIEVKENKYRYTITNLILDWGDGIHTEPFESVQKMYHKKLYTYTHVQVREIIASFKSQMATKKTDW